MQKDSQFTRIAVLLFHAIFIGQLFTFFLPRRDSAGLGDWLSSAAAAALCVIGAIETSIKWRSFPSQLKMWLVMAGLFASVATLRGVFDDEDILKTMLESIPFFAIATLPVFGFPRIPDSLTKAFTYHAVVGVIACAYVLITNRNLVMAEVVQRSETLELKPVQFTLYSLFFVFFRLTQLSKATQVIVLLGLLEMAAFAVASGTRQALLLLSAIILMGVWIVFRTVDVKKIRLRVKKFTLIQKLLMVFAVCGVLSFGLYQISTKLTGGMTLLQSRLTSQRHGTSIADNSRWYEIEQLIDQFGVEDYAFGRGVRGNFVNAAAPKQDNVHIGWFRVLLKSGVGMVILLLIGPVYSGIRSILKTREPLVLAAAGMCCYFAIKNTSGNIVLATPVFYLVMVCFGTCAAYRWGVCSPRLRQPQMNVNRERKWVEAQR